MNDHIAVIDKNPTRFDNAFAPTRLEIILLRGVFFDPVGDGFQLPLAGAGAHDEVIDVGRKLAQIELHNIFALFVLNGVNNAMSEF